MMWTIISLVLLVAYSVLIIAYIIGWQKIKKYPESENFTEFSIIIPFRNEADVIQNLLNCINKIEYPKDKFELIFVDDDSEDISFDIVDEWLIKNDFQALILSAEGGKKNAIELAIKHASNNYILQQDADNILKPKILQAYNSLIQKTDAELISAPVVFENSNRFLKKVFALEFSSLIVSAASAIQLSRPIMINAANMAYKRESFLRLVNMQKDMKSGDDIFILESFKMKMGADKIHFLKDFNAIVETRSPENLQEFFEQRIRWTSKDSKVKDFDYLFVAFLIFLININLIALGFSLVFSTQFLALFLIFLIIKLILDASLLIGFLKFTKKISLLKYFFPAFILSVIYISIIGILGHFIKVKWKNRRI